MATASYYKGLSVLKPMHHNCKVCIVVPIYNESKEVVSRLLDSLVRQMGISKEAFEVVMVVNNSRVQAQTKTAEYKRNREILAMVKRSYKGGLRVVPVDASRISNAPERNNVGVARNLGGQLAAARFMSSYVGEQGIIAMTDCDCAVSSNYVYELIESFREPHVYAAVGRWNLEPSPEILYPEVVLAMIEVHLGRKIVRHNPRINDRLPIAHKKRDRVKGSVLGGGHNLAVRVSAWHKVGGMLPLPSYEDMDFAKRISLLPGDIACNPNFVITTLVRPSMRTGLISFGRRVAEMAKAATDFMEGRSEHLFVLDLRASWKMFLELHAAFKARQVAPAAIKTIMEKWGAVPPHFGPSHYERFSKLINDVNPHQAERGVAELESFIFDHIYAHLPHKEVML